MNAQEGKHMKALKRWTLGGALLAAALATGCVAQVGQGNEDPGSSPEQLTAEQPAAAAVAAPAQQKDIQKLQVIQTPDGKLVIGPVQGAEQLRIGPGVDPGAPIQDDGDGREPDPHPWHGGTVVIAR
jgi:hypothetical protein